MMQQHRRLQIVRQAIDRGQQLPQRLVVLERGARSRRVRGEHVVQRRAVGIRRLKTHRGMPPAPAMLIVTKIGQGREQPRGNSRVRPQSLALLIESHESFRHEIARIGVVLHVAPRESEKRLLPPIDQAIESAVVTALKCDKLILITFGIGGHKG